MTATPRGAEGRVSGRRLKRRLKTVGRTRSRLAQVRGAWRTATLWLVRELAGLPRPAC